MDEEKKKELVKICYDFVDAFLKLNIPPEYTLKLLIAEDNLITQQLYSRLFSKYPTVFCKAVINGELALKCAQKEHYDCIILDVEMPILNGIDACQQIRLHDKSEKIVIMTSNAKYEKEAFDAGCEYFLLKDKGYRIDSLIPIIETLTGYKFE